VWFLANVNSFSKRELTFMFAVCCRPSICLSAICLLSFCRVSSVCNACVPYSAGMWDEMKFSAMFLTIWYIDRPLTAKKFTEIVPGELLHQAGLANLNPADLNHD